MIHKKIVHHIRHLHHQVLPHLHDDGGEHRAHAISLVALFVYLQIFVAVTGGFYLIKTKVPQILGTVTFSAEQIISLTNAKRAENGLGALTFNPLLANAASAKASNMFTENYWAHNSPSGKTPWSFITAAGYRYIYAGENLARDFSDAQSVVNAWMNSSSHRSNLLDKNFKEIGVAVASGTLTGNEGILVVQEFGSGVSQVPAQVALATPVPSSVPTTAPKVVDNTLPKPTTGPTASPKPTASVTPQPTVEPTPLVVAQIPEISEPIPLPGPTGSGSVVLSSRQFSISKMISLALVGFVFLLFTVEVLTVLRKERLHLRSGILAHLGILAFLLLVIWYAVGGTVL